MKSHLQRLADEELKAYRIKDRLEGWFFRIQEVSNGVYEVEGIDAWGRKVSCKGMENELDEILEACVNEARQIQSKFATE